MTPIDLSEFKQGCEFRPTPQQIQHNKQNKTKK